MIDFTTPHLSPSDIVPEAQAKLGLENYSKPSIEGVQRLPLNNFVGEQGDFCEVLRLNEAGELQNLPGFKLRQINRSLLYPNTIKAWHLHFKQNEIWFVPPHSTLMLGLHDARQNSPTQGTTLRLTLGAGRSEMILIPKGVAHGLMTLSQENTHLLYLVDQQFNLEEPDEHRLPWDYLGAEFWTPEKN